MGSKKTISLSPSALNLFRDCPRCFWLEKARGIKRPRGIFPSLPSGMDRVIKDYFDTFRQKNTLPPEFKDKAFDGIELYQDQRQLEDWRDWRTGPRFKDEDGSVLFGALDDLMVKDGIHIPFDYKTKGSPTSAADAKKYYTNQLDCYALMIQSNGLEVADYGYLLYYSPKNVSEKGWVQFNLQLIKVPTDTQRAYDLFRKAIELIRSNEAPQIEACEYCQWVKRLESNSAALSAMSH